MSYFCHIVNIRRIMKKISREDFKTLIKKERASFFGTPFDLAYKAFVELGFSKKKPSYFRNNASDFVEKMRDYSWNEFIPAERAFTIDMLKKLIDYGKVSKLCAGDAIEQFVADYVDHIYDLSLSNTQSRRSRGGKDFESIIELLMIAANVPCESQAALGKSCFTERSLGKVVDLVSPGCVQYLANKRNTVLISAKTTLRERWQEVPEEVTRTGCREMYLATLDKNITRETLNILYDANVIIVTTQQFKQTCYSNDSRILSFEELIHVILETAQKWESFVYSDDDVELLKRDITAQIENHSEHPFVESYYQERLRQLLSGQT